MTDELSNHTMGDWIIRTNRGLGGQIVQASWCGLDVLVPGAPARAAADQHAGCFPLVPYSNRVRGGKFRFANREIILPPPDYAEPHALHGRGWRGSWFFNHYGPGSCRMTFSHPRGSWPWHYHMDQTLTTNGASLTVSLMLLNLDTTPMPAGIGLHPYFHRPEGFWLKAATGGRWATDPREPGLPVGREAAPADLGAEGLDHCFYGWDGQAEFGGKTGLQFKLAASGALKNLVIYTPPGKPYVCIEPVSHVNDAINLEGLTADESMTILQPGEFLSGEMTISVRTK